MADVHTKDRRSYNMSMIKGKDTKPEVKLRKYLFSKGLRGYRLHYRSIGRPDIVFTRRKVAVFIDGCFWHKCPECFKGPKTNKKFWSEKINSNIKRDKKVTRELKSQGWRVLRIWEHELKRDLNSIYQRIKKCMVEK